MVKFFSVDWLAQSHLQDQNQDQDRVQDQDQDPGPRAQRPHVPCVVQPSRPTFGTGYLQPKNRVTARPAQESREPESPKHQKHPASCESPASELSGYSSGYDSEAAASSECLSSLDEGSDAEKDAPQRRVRTKFTPEQISRLEKIFNKHKYLDAGERVKTAHKLNLSETQVRTWFQNRRMKLKREVQDFLAPQVQPLILHSLHHYHGLAPPHRTPYYPHPPQQVLLQHRPPLPHPHPHHHIMIPNPHFY